MTRHLVARLRAGVARVTTELYRAYHATLRIDVVSPDGSAAPARGYPIGGGVYAILERDLVALGGLVAGTGVVVLVTPGKDGDRASAVATRLGCRIVRGSRLHDGWRALRELVRALRGAPAAPAAVVVDGPVGPAGVPHAGALALAVAARRPLRAVGVAARRRLVVPWTWSGIYVPLPFTRVVVACDDPWTLPQVERLDDLESLLPELGERLQRRVDDAATLLKRTAPGTRHRAIIPGRADAAFEAKQGARPLTR